MIKKEYTERVLAAWEKCSGYNFCELINAVLERKYTCTLGDLSDDELLFELENFATTQKRPYTLEIKGSFSAIQKIDARDELEAKTRMFDMIEENLSYTGMDLEDFSASIYKGDEQ